MIAQLLCEPTHIREERRALTEQQKIVFQASQVLSRDIDLQLGDVDINLEHITNQVLSGNRFFA